MARKLLDTNFNIKTFNIKYDNNLSSLTKTILESIKIKLYYYVIEDLFYILKSNPYERAELLKILHSTIVYLQNNLQINYFDIYIYEIYINEVPKFNRFIISQSKNVKYVNSITIKLAYQIKPITKKIDNFW